MQVSLGGDTRGAEGKRDCDWIGRGNTPVKLDEGLAWKWKIGISPD